MIWEYYGVRYTVRTKAVGSLRCREPGRIKGWIRMILTLTSDLESVAERYANCEDITEERLDFAMGEAERYLEEHRELSILRFDDLVVYRDDPALMRHTEIDGRKYTITLCRDCPFFVSTFDASDLCNHPDRVRRLVCGECYPPECCPLSGVR